MLTFKIQTLSTAWQRSVNQSKKYNHSWKAKQDRILAA